jgi:hypothetical protein
MKHLSRKRHRPEEVVAKRRQAVEAPVAAGAAARAAEALETPAARHGRERDQAPPNLDEEQCVAHGIRAGPDL